MLTLNIKKSKLQMLHELMGKKFDRSNFSLWLFIKLAHFLKQMSARSEDGLHIITLSIRDYDQSL